MKRFSKSRVYNKYTSHISQQEDTSREGLKRWVGYYKAHYLKFLPKNKDSKILEIGCGYGRLLYYLKKQGYTSTYGIDISPEQIEKAKEHKFEKTEVISAFDFLKSKEDKFDTIIMLDVLEHFEKDEILELIDLIYSSLAVDGKLILQLPNALTPLDIHRYWDFTHETAFTTASIRQLLALADFKHIRVFPIVPHIHGPRSFVFNIMWRVFWQNLIRLYMYTANGNLMGDIYTSNLIAIAEK